MSGIFARLARLFSATPTITESPSIPSPPDRSFGPIDSNAVTAQWFDGNAPSMMESRNSVDSNPDTARWYRRPRFVPQNAASHRSSLVGGGS